MGTEVLRPQDVLGDRFGAIPASFQRRRNFTGDRNLSNIMANPKASNKTGHKKTSAKTDKKKFHATAENSASKKSAANGGGPVMGQVTLLRRGESFDSFTKVKDENNSKRQRSPKAKSPKPKSADDLAVIGTGRIGPESPEMLPKQIRLSPPPLANMYAGSAFSLSPSPRALPLPSFFNKKPQDDSQSIPSDDDSATRDLRRLLRLD